MDAAVLAPAPGGATQQRSRLDSLKRVLAILLLPASIAPVPLLGPTLLRAPRKLWREASAEVQRLQEHSRGSAHAHRPVPQAPAPKAEGSGR